MRDQRLAYILAAVFVVMALFASAMFLFFDNEHNDFIKESSKQSVTSFKRIVPRMAQPMGKHTNLFQKLQFPGKNNLYTVFMREPARPWPLNVKFPLVVFLHGASGRVYGTDHLISDDMAYKYPAFVIVPVLGGGTYWALPTKISGDPRPQLNEQYALNDVVSMIQQIATSYPIDTTRIYVVGCSDGGTGVFGAAQYYPDVFAAGLALSGSWDPEEGINMTDMPLWIMHGQYDSIIPAEQTKALAEIIKSRGGPVHFTEFENMEHECGSPLLYSEASWKWLFKQKNQ